MGGREGRRVFGVYVIELVDMLGPAWPIIMGNCHVDTTQMSVYLIKLF